MKHRDTQSTVLVGRNDVEQDKIEQLQAKLYRVESLLAILYNECRLGNRLCNHSKGVLQEVYNILTKKGMEVENG